MSVERVRILVCGSRDWDDPAPIRWLLQGLHSLHRDRLLIIHGDARGADRMARDIARGMGIEDLPFPANWRGHGRYAAGPIRNKLMLDEGRPCHVYAVKDDINWALDKGGTENMVLIALDANVPCDVYDRGQWCRAERTSDGARPRAA